MSSTEDGSEPSVNKSALLLSVVQNMSYVSAVAQFAVASVAMMVGNKQAVTALPLPCTVVIIQCVGTLLLLGFCRQHLKPIEAGTAKHWLPIAVLFALMIFTSMKTFVYVGVSTVIIMRNVGAIVTTVVEYYVRGVTVNRRIVASEVAIVVGAVMYGWGAVDFNWTGLFWLLVNVGGQVAYGVTVKKLTDIHAEIRDMSKYTMSLYNNTLALPLIAVVLVLQKEHEVISDKVAAVTAGGWAVIAVTCFFGFLISTSGFGLQKLVSATTFLVINNLTKFFNILLGVLFMNDKLVGFSDAAGCVVALGAGFWYSYESILHADSLRQQVTAKNDGDKP